MIMEIFENIQSKNGKTRIISKGPVSLDKADRLHIPKITQGIVEIMNGNLDPEMFDRDVREKKEHKEK
ncbi:MAG: hypothetical protein WCL18_00275 [bacterium]